MKLRVMTVKEAYECERAYMLSRESEKHAKIRAELDERIAAKFSVADPNRPSERPSSNGRDATRMEAPFREPPYGKSTGKRKERRDAHKAKFRSYPDKAA